MLQFLHQSPQIIVIKGHDYFSGSYHTLANAETEIIVDEWRGFNGVEIVELWTRLPSDHKHVFKTFCRDQCDARAAALQQRVRADSRAVYDLYFGKLCVSFSADTRETLANRERRI